MLYSERKTIVSIVGNRRKGSRYHVLRVASQRRKVRSRLFPIHFPFRLIIFPTQISCYLPAKATTKTTTLRVFTYPAFRGLERKGQFVKSQVTPWISRSHPACCRGSNNKIYWLGLISSTNKIINTRCHFQTTPLLRETKIMLVSTSYNHDSLSTSDRIKAPQDISKHVHNLPYDILKLAKAASKV